MNRNIVLILAAMGASLFALQAKGQEPNKNPSAQSVSVSDTTVNQVDSAFFENSAESCGESEVSRRKTFVIS